MLSFKNYTAIYYDDGLVISAINC